MVAVRVRSWGRVSEGGGQGLGGDQSKAFLELCVCVRARAAWLKQGEQAWSEMMTFIS